MTKVIINKNFQGQQKIVHKAGNWYNNKTQGLHILCNVAGKGVLVSATGGWFFSEPVSFGAEGAAHIPQHIFEAICAGREFTFVPSITITEGEPA